MTRVPDRPDAPFAAIARRVLDGLDDLLPRMGATYQREIDEYARLTPRQLEHEILQTSRRFIEGYFGRLAAGRDAEGIDLSALSQAGRRRLEMGISLDSALHAFRLAGRETWQAVVAAVDEDEHHVLGPLAAAWIDHMDRASSSFAEGYVAASHEHLRRLDARRSAIVDALLEAQDWGEVASVAARWSLALAPRYRPVLLAGDDVLVRIDLLVQNAPPDTLAGRRGTRVLALLPDERADPRLLAKAANAQLTTYGRAVAPGPELLAEVRHVEAVLLAAERAGHLEGAFGPDDLLLEQLLAGSERVVDGLAARVLDPLVAQDPDGIFVATLRTYLASGSIPETAEVHVVHPNTVAYRLRRVREVTGLDPRVPTDAALLVVAAMARGGTG
ncbi:PucR family transcriptional regulator [Egicoccus sp. AB-alg6-2]|uniref:PucR family transcriptional regulator n=1 Tax=Egicoccus sp. AB-alg6-2 TaxID=3242692 RepID=UPI00359E5088